MLDDSKSLCNSDEIEARRYAQCTDKIRTERCVCMLSHRKWICKSSEASPKLTLAAPRTNWADPAVLPNSTALLERHCLKGLPENTHLAIHGRPFPTGLRMTQTPNANPSFSAGNRGIGKTTIAALVAQYFRGNRQPPNNWSMRWPPPAPAPSTSASPRAPRRCDPRSFALTIASQWASRDSNFAHLQSTIDRHDRVRTGRVG